jgi:hypothetical protein
LKKTWQRCRVRFARNFEQEMPHAPRAQWLVVADRHLKKLAKLGAIMDDAEDKSSPS